MRITAKIMTGIEKSICEDTALIGDNIINAEQYNCDVDNVRIIAIADGVGGNAGGREASVFIMKYMQQTVFSPDESRIKESLLALNTELLNYAADAIGRENMATTFSAIINTNGGYYLAHIGNTRIYVGQGHYIKQMTTDHTTYRWLLNHGQTEAAAACNKNEISACFGGGAQHLIESLEVRKVFEPGMPQTLLLTSDGIHEYVNQDKIEEELFSGKEDSVIADNLMSCALENGSEDDRTIVIVRL